MAATILYIEDNIVNMRMVCTILQRIGYTMVSAMDGEEGMRITREIHPDLILMDINLPGMDGLEATRKLKSNPRTADIPIIAVTAYVGLGNRERCLDAGCDEFIPKPISLKHLRDTIERFVNTDDREGAQATNS